MDNIKIPWRQREEVKKHLRDYNKIYQRTYSKKPGVRERYRILNRNLDRKKRTAVLNLLGGPKCVKCGFSDIRALQIDHINGGGTKEIRKYRTHYRYSLYLNDPNIKKKLQVLCANCNWIKEYDKRHK